MTTIFDIMRLKSLVAVGDVEAMYTLGCNYLYGVGVEADIVKAYSYFNKAAGKGFEPAKGLMEAVFADKGKSASLAPEFKEDIYEAFKTMCQEADKGDPGALHLKSMAKLSDDTDDFRFHRAVKDMEQACQKDYAPALYSLGIVYERGNRIKGKQQEGLAMILRAAEKEFIPALQYMMGVWPEKVYLTIKKMVEKEDADVKCSTC